MGLRDRLRREVTRGGSVVRRHEGRSPDVGVTAEQFTAEREQFYDWLWGTCETVSHEVVPLVPHVDVYAYEPTEERPFYTLVTGGMSDLPMPAPRGSRDWRRSELLLYADEPADELVELLRWLAHVPHAASTWLGPLHTLATADPPEPLFEGSELTSIFLVAPLPGVEPPATLADPPLLGGDPLRFLTVVPITTAEANLKLERGADALLVLLHEVGHPAALDVRRGSYV